MRPDEICVRTSPASRSPTRPLASAIVPTSVWICNDTQQAESLLNGTADGYVYQRDGHPNADEFAARCGELHGAERTVVASSGMAALSAAILAICQAGDHLVISRQLYGRSLKLLTEELPRMGMRCSLVDPSDPQAWAAALQSPTRLAVVETMSNPRLEVVDIARLAAQVHSARAQLLVDNTFATPVLCRPLQLGADWVMESVSKMMNGHSDVMLGLLCGHADRWERVPSVLASWGLASSPFDCWLAARGLATLALRMERACQNALAAARFLSTAPSVSGVDYPGLPDHPQHALAAEQFGGRFGCVVTFHLEGGRAAADRFLGAARRIPFCPSLGEVQTSISHPESTSHRGLTAAARTALGIHGGTMRLSLGIESEQFVQEALREGLAG